MPDSGKTRRLIKSSGNGAINISDEERERRSQRARELNEAGKIGGKEFGKLGGRPRKKTATDVQIERMQEHSDLIWSAFHSALQESQPPYVRMQAAVQLLKIEQQWIDRQKDETFNGDDEALKKELKERIERIYGSVPGEIVGLVEGSDGEAAEADEGTRETS